MPSILILIATALAFASEARAEHELKVNERLKSSRVTVAGVLAWAGLEDFSSEDVSRLMVSIYRNDGTMYEMAAASGCPAFINSEQIESLAVSGAGIPPGACYCTDTAAVFDKWVAPVFVATAQMPAEELFRERKAKINGYDVSLVGDRNGVVKGGWLHKNLLNKLKFKLFIKGKEHGQTAHQQFCDFKGRFKLFTSTGLGNYIGVNVLLINQKLKSGAPLGVDSIIVRDGEVTAAE